MATQNPYSDSLLMDALRGSLSNAESLGRGFAVAPVGLLGDVNALARQYVTPRLPQSVQGLLQSAPAAPTTEQILSNIPRVSNPRMETAGMEQLGAAMNPRGPIDLARGAERAAMAAGRAGERYAERVVPQIMERGGLPAQLLGDLSQGSRRQIFIGQSSPLYKGDNAIKAQRMYKDEVPMLQIKQQTGMERTPSGEWVQEMSDVGSRFKPDVATQLNDYGVRKQKTVFEHPTAFDAYSDLGDVTLMRDGSRVADYTGYYEPSKDMIGISLPRKDVNLDYARDTNLHELQHAIQKREGWAQGGSPEMFMQQKEAELSRDALSWNKELENAAKRYPNEDRGFIESVVINDYINSGVPDWIVSPESRSLASTLAKDQEQFDTANRLVKLYGLDRKTTPFTPDQMYKNLEGEAMSRLVQKRKDMNQDELLNSLAFDYSPTSNQKGLDVRPENLLYLNEAGEIRKSLLD